MMRNLMVVLLGLALSGCHDRLEPHMCVFRADTGVDPDMVDVTACPGPFSVKDGEAFFLLHELPPGIEAPEPLSVRLETPCQATTFTRDHTATRLLVPLTAPPGAGCDLTVTTTVANSELHQNSAPGGADACAQCPVIDAGTDGGGGAGGGTGGGTP